MGGERSLKFLWTNVGRLGWLNVSLERLWSIYVDIIDCIYEYTNNHLKANASKTQICSFHLKTKKLPGPLRSPG